MDRICVAWEAVGIRSLAEFSRMGAPGRSQASQRACAESPSNFVSRPHFSLTPKPWSKTSAHQTFSRRRDQIDGLVPTSDCWRRRVCKAALGLAHLLFSFRAVSFRFAWFWFRSESGLDVLCCGSAIIGLARYVMVHFDFEFVWLNLVWFDLARLALARLAFT